MQVWARSVELPDGPALFMIEDETGSGKTEAALMLAHRLMATCHAEGIYVALPTMATANAMFDRLAVAHRRLFAVHATPSVALVHGAREMHQGFRSAMRSGGRSELPYSQNAQRGEASETTASAACAAWIADDRRRAFLADVGAGTVDQALLSVLPSRHQSLRLLGPHAPRPHSRRGARLRCLYAARDRDAARTRGLVFPAGAGMNRIP